MCHSERFKDEYTRKKALYKCHVLILVFCYSHKPWIALPTRGPLARPPAPVSHAPGVTSRFWLIHYYYYLYIHYTFKMNIFLPTD